MKRKRILITGGAGFIGSNLVDRLVRENEVVVLDNLSSGSKVNLRSVQDRIELVEGDIRNKSLVNRLVPKFDLIFHLAANASVPNSVDDPKYDFETNVIGTFNLLNASVGSKLRRFVFASSAAVYGVSSAAPLAEDYPPKPVSPYGSSKLCGEILGLSFKQTYDVPVAIARIFNVYGPRLPRYAIYDFYMKLHRDPKELNVLGDGEQTRQFCHVTDATDALLLIAEKGEGIYNIAGKERVKIGELARLMVSIIAPGAKIVFTGKSWTGDIKNLVANISKLGKLGYKPKIDLYQGIKMTVEWFDENLGPVRAASEERCTE